MINDDIVKLHELRKELATVNNLWKARAAQFDLDNQDLKQSAQSLAQQVTIAEAELKRNAVALYEQDSSTKQIAPGIVIKEVVQVGYDRKKAFNWAVEHKMALTLDEKTFEKIAVTQNFDWFIALKVPKATVATDLFKAVNEIQEAVNVQ